MSLPIITLPSDERWDCHQCGHCCRGSLVPLSTADARKLSEQRWEEHPDFEGIRILTPHRGAESSFRLAHRDDGSCVFLKEDGLCQIHAELGLEAKPTICQTFPLQLIPREKNAVLTIRRACPSAAGDRGESIRTRLPRVKQLVKEGRLTAESVPAPMLKLGEQRPWKTIQSVLKSAGSLLRDERYPPVRRLVHALQFAKHLEAAKTRRLTDQQIIELAQTLAELEPEESKPFFAERQPPRSYSKVLLRRTAMVCGRLHPHCRHRASWRARLELAQLAFKILRGKGRLPSFDSVYPITDFQQIETPLGIQAADIYAPLTRLIATTAESYSYAIANRGRWSVVDSIRGLAMTFPVGMWLLRWLTYDREPTVEDMLQVIVILDRSQGYGPLCGLLYRQQLSVLAFNEELERLVVWYAA